MSPVCAPKSIPGSSDAAGNIAWTAEGSALTGNTCDRASVPASSRIVRQYDSMNRMLSIDYPDNTVDYPVATADINNTYEARRTGSRRTGSAENRVGSSKVASLFIAQRRTGSGLVK
jgi:hypothetical protein